MNCSMTEEKQRSGVRRVFGSAVFFAGICVAALLLVIGFFRAYYQDYAVREEIGNLERQIDMLKKKKLASVDLLSYVASNDFVEEKARLELNMKKPGEHVLVAHARGSDGNRESQTALTGQSQGNPLQWWYYFFPVKSSL